MSVDERRESVAFDPAPLGPRRPSMAVVLGVAVVLVGLVVAIVKPWDLKLAPTASDVVSASAATATGPPPAPSTGPTGPEPATLPISAAVAAAIVPHDGWGVRAIVRSPTEQERWVAVDGGPESGSIVDTGSRDEPIAALGVTSPRVASPLDVRVWRPTAEGGWAWLDVRPVAPTLTGGELLFWPPGQDGGSLGVWPAGRYRFEVLTGSTVRHIDVAVRGRFERVPADLPAPSPPGELVPAEPFVPSAVRPGSFLVADGVATSLATTAGSGFDAASAWLQAMPVAEGGDGSVATMWQPRANALGVVFPARTWLANVELHRLAPGPLVADPEPIVGQAPLVDGSAPYALFVPPDGGVWAPGTYEIEASWTEGGARLTGAWGIELRPGAYVATSSLLDAARGFAPYAGATDLSVGTDVRLPESFSGTGCDEQRSDPAAAVLGLSHPAGVAIVDATARLSLPGGRSLVVPLRVVPEVTPGMTLVAPANGGTFAAGRYRLELLQVNGAERRTVCLGSVPIDG